MTELFPAAAMAMPSPKLAWLDRHGLTIMRKENGKFECVLDDDNFGKGDTEEEACADLCIKTRLPHWTTS